MIGILGASGDIGGEFYAYMKKRTKRLLGTYCTMTKPGFVKFDLMASDPSIFSICDAVVIMGGVTNIDECARRHDEAHEINVVRMIKLIKYLADRKIKPVFISSDQVFDGRKGNYSESDMPCPINRYGEFKLKVECFMKENLDDYLALRLSKTYSRYNNWGVFAETVMKMKQHERVKAAYNLISNPTEAGLVCEGIYKAINTGLKGLYHLADARIMNRYDFIISIANEFGFDTGLVDRIDFNELQLLEKRALNTSLNVQRILSLLKLSGALL